MQAGPRSAVMVKPEQVRRHPAQVHRPRHRQAGSGGAHLPRPDPRHGFVPRVPRDEFAAELAQIKPRIIQNESSAA